MSTTEQLKPGQKHPTPTKGFGDRVFYETLLRQNPKSEMAQEWCVAYGVLTTQEAEKIYKMVLKRKKKVPAASAFKTKSKSKTKVVKKEKKGVIKEEVADVGMDMGGSEGIGGVII